MYDDVRNIGHNVDIVSEGAARSREDMKLLHLLKD